MIKNFLNTQTKSISFASLILAVSYVCSAMLGLLRERLLAGKFGAGNELDVYYSAFVVPDFIALILIFGAISAAIIPIFSSYYVDSKEEAWKYVGALLKMFLLFFIIVCAVFIIFAPFFVHLIAPGFSEAKKETTVLLMRIMFLSPMILGISNVIGGILQVFHRFLTTALAPIMYNAGIIIGILFFVPLFGLPGLAFGVVLGGVLHLAIQVPAFLHSGFQISNFKFQIQGFFHPGVKKTLVLMLPRSLGLGAGQFNTIVTTAIASTLVSGSVAVFNLAHNLSSLFVNVIAVSLSTAVFPSMALAYSKIQKKEFEKKFSGAFLQVLFLIIPIGVLLFLLRAQVVRAVLGTGKFSWLDTRLTAACLGIFAVGLVFSGLIFIFSKTFYAAHNTRIPALISIGTVAFNILMSFFLVRLLIIWPLFFKATQSWLRLDGIDDISIVGLALAYVVTAALESLLLLYFLYAKLKVFRIRSVTASLAKIASASAVMGVAVFFVRQSLVWFRIVSLQTFWGVFLQLAVSGIAGIIVYILISFILKSSELSAIKKSFFNNNSNGNSKGK